MKTSDMNKMVTRSVYVYGISMNRQALCSLNSTAAHRGGIEVLEQQFELSLT